MQKKVWYTRRSDGKRIRVTEAQRNQYVSAVQRATRKRAEKAEAEARTKGLAPWLNSRGKIEYLDPLQIQDRIKRRERATLIAMSQIFDSLSETTVIDTIDAVHSFVSDARPGQVIALRFKARGERKFSVVKRLVVSAMYGQGFYSAWARVSLFSAIYELVEWRNGNRKDKRVINLASAYEIFSDEALKGSPLSGFVELHKPGKWAKAWDKAWQ